MDRIQRPVQSVNPAKLSQVMGDFLGQYAWEVFGTVTFARYEPTFPAARRIILRFLRWLEEQRGDYVGAYWVLELHRWRPGSDPVAKACPHAHLLLTNVTGLDWRSVWRHVYARYGRARFERVRGGAAHYVAKYVAKEVFERGSWDIWRPEVIQRSLGPLRPNSTEFPL